MSDTPKTDQEVERIRQAQAMKKSLEYRLLYGDGTTTDTSHDYNFFPVHPHTHPEEKRRWWERLLTRARGH
jgi:hypothetical protein